MPYISKSNASRIVEMMDFNKSEKFQGAVYTKPIDVFGHKDKSRLLALQQLFSDPQHFFDRRYAKIVNLDTLRYIYEGAQPAYHSINDCPKLSSIFLNFKIPEKIIEEGTEKVKLFREWFKENKDLLAQPDIFEMRVQAAFGIYERITEIERIPSGVEEIENLDLGTLEGKIDSLLNQIEEYYNKADDKTKNVINVFKKTTNISYRTQPITNRLNFTDRALKDFLKKYHEAFKIPLLKLLKEYYRLKSNPLLSFDGNMLEQLGFRPCSTCHEKY